MKTLRAETNRVSQRRGHRFLLASIVIVLGLPLILYYGYCWGRWGQQSLLFQYLFQCSCPVNSEESRYPEHVDVIVPACRHASSILSPSGRLLYVEEEWAGIISSYILDLQTAEKTPFTLSEESDYFLNDELIFHSFYGDNEYIVDIKTGRQYPVQRFSRLHSDAYINGEFNLTLLAEELRRAKDVFLIDNDLIVALGSDSDPSPATNFVTGWFDILGTAQDLLEKFLQENEITYYQVLDLFPGEVISPNGKFIARNDGIYLLETNQKIVEGYSASGRIRAYSGKYFSLRGWAYDSGGALYSAGLTPCILEFDYPACLIRVPQPLLKLNVPEEYLIAN
jgi:hypothetical protein